MEKEEIEINFRLDEDGRTALQSLASSTDTNTNTTTTSRIDYTTTASLTHFILEKRDDCITAEFTENASIVVNHHHVLYDELLLDCEIADSGLMPRTFWVPADHANTGTTDCHLPHPQQPMSKHFSPRCNFEQMAFDIFQHHTRDAIGTFDPLCSGAEWWVQIRPSPEKTGRYSMHAPAAQALDKNHNDNTEETNDNMEDSGICFHWDKDEDLRLLCGGTTYVHPHLSTVTYLTAVGAPTLVAEGFRIHNLTGEWHCPETASAYVSWPYPGKHLKFDGRFLHAAPANLQAPGAFKEQCQDNSSKTHLATDEFSQRKRAQQRRHRRCTFLVNVWLNYQPFNVNPFPESMLEKMSGFRQPSACAGTNDFCSKTNDAALNKSITAKEERVRLIFLEDHTGAPNSIDATVHSDLSVRTRESSRAETAGNSIDPSIAKPFIWPMGSTDSGESIHATIPLSAIRGEESRGGNIKISWQNDSNNSHECMGIFLAKTNNNASLPSKRPRREEGTDL